MCLIVAQNVFSQQKDSLRYEIMLNSSMLDTSIKTENFIGSIGISPDKFLTLSSGTKIYMLGWGGIAPLGNPIDNSINAFSYTNDGLLMAIKKDELCFMNEKGNLEKIIQLPTSQMGITSGKEVMYLFDQIRNDNSYKLYAFAKAGKYKQLLVSPKPITTVVEMKDSVYVAIESGVYSLSPKNNTLSLLTGFQKENKIKSMEVDTLNNILYISTREGIYALKNDSLKFITSDFKENILMYYEGGLVIFDTKTKDIVRIVNINKSIPF